MNHEPRTAQSLSRRRALAARQADPRPAGNREGELELIDKTNPLWLQAEAERAALPPHVRQLIGLATVRALSREDPAVTIVPHG